MESVSRRESAVNHVAMDDPEWFAWFKSRCQGMVPRPEPLKRLKREPAPRLRIGKEERKPTPQFCFSACIHVGGRRPIYNSVFTGRNS